MRTRAYQLWERLQASYWFVPSVMAVLSVCAALGAEALDRRLTEAPPPGIAWLFPAGAEGARALLTTIAGSMVTVAGVVFSITMVALVLASSQFGPRILGSFMRDRGNQFVLGTFLATFLYCLVALRTVSAAEGELFVPRATVSVAIGLAVASIAVLIYFIDHVATSIQAPNVAERVLDDLLGVIGRTFPDADEDEAGGGATGAGGGADSAREGRQRAADGSRASSGAAAAAGRGHPVRAARDGYVQLVDLGGLVDLCAERGLTCRMTVEPGDHVLHGAPLLLVTGDPGAADATDVDDLPEDRLRGHVVLGSQRTARHSPAFAFRQLVEIAVRALSPGINDPFTACDCLDGLGTALAEIARRPPPPRRLSDDSGRVRVERPVQDFAGLADTAFAQIRLHGRSMPTVLVHLARTIAAVGAHVRRPADLEALRGHVEATWAAARETALPDGERRPVERAREEALAALDAVEVAPGSPAAAGRGRQP